MTVKSNTFVRFPPPKFVKGEVPLAHDMTGVAGAVSVVDSEIGIDWSASQQLTTLQADKSRKAARNLGLAASLLFASC